MDGRTLKVNIFYCANSLDGQELIRFHDHWLSREQQGDTLREIRLPCSGKVDIPYLLKAYEAGAGAVVLVTCKQGQCRHLEGNLRAQRRAQAVDALLAEVGLGTGRIAVVQRKDAGVEQVIEEIEAFRAKVRDMPRHDTELRPSRGMNGSSTLNVHEHQETAP